MSEGRLVLGVGSGERLNEHVTGRPFPPVEVRHRMLGEAIDALRALWAGGFTSYRGEFVTVEDARIYDLPPSPIPVVVGVSGDASLDLAHAHGADGIMAIDADAALIDGWVGRGGARTDTWTEVPFAYAPTEEEGLALAWDRMRFAAAGWKVMAELPNPVNFAAAAAPIPREVIGASVPHGPDPQPYIDAVRSYLDAGFGRIAILPVGDDIEGTFRFWEQEVRPALATVGITQPASLSTAAE
jgi:G6PDH family F420-dependent oxidoreductase